MAQKKKAQVFISYSWKDQAAAKQIEAALKEDPFLAANLDIWRDQNVVKPGDHIASKVTEALTATDYFVLLVSDNSLASNWVQREIDTAVSLADKKKLTPVPILLSQVQVPFEFRGLLFIDGRPSLGEAIKRLLEFLRSQLTRVEEVEPRQIMRKSADERVMAWKTCQDKLRELKMGDLRYHLTERLTLAEVKVVWYDVFGKKMDDEVQAQNLAMCCVELLDRSRREDAIVELIDTICRNHPSISKSLAN